MGSQMLSGKNNDLEWVGYYDKFMHQINFPYPWEKKEVVKKNFFLKILLKKNISQKF